MHTPPIASGQTTPPSMAAKEKKSCLMISTTEKTFFIALAVISALVFFLTVPAVAAIVYTLLTVGITAILYFALSRLCCTPSSSTYYHSSYQSYNFGIGSSSSSFPPAGAAASYGSSSLYGRARRSASPPQSRRVPVSPASGWGSSFESGLSGTPNPYSSNGSGRATVGAGHGLGMLSGTPKY